MSISIDVNPGLKYSVIGVNGQGKSVFFRYLVKKALAAGWRVVLFDPEKQYGKARHPGLVVYQPEVPDSVEEFDALAGKVWERGGPILFAVESIDFFAAPKGNLPPNLKKIVHWGREQGIGLLTTSRRPANVHKDILGLGAGLFLFHVYEPNDIKWLKGIIGKELADRLKGLPKFFFYFWNQEEQAKLQNPIREEEARL